VTLNLHFKVTGLLLMPLTYLCEQLTHDLFAIAKFLLNCRMHNTELKDVESSTWPSWPFTPPSNFHGAIADTFFRLFHAHVI